MIEGTGLEHLCHLADRPEHLISTIEGLMGKAFEEDQILERKNSLKEFSNQNGASKIIGLLS